MLADVAAASSAARPASPPTARRCRSMFGISFGPQLQVYYLIAGWASSAAIAMYAFTRTPLGRMVQRGARQPRARRIRRLRPAVRALSSPSLRRASSPASPAACTRSTSRSSLPTHVGATAPASCCSSTFIGGVGYFFGPIIGAVLVTCLQIGAVRLHRRRGSSTSACSSSAMVMFAPGGIASLIDDAPAAGARRHARARLIAVLSVAVVPTAGAGLPASIAR